MTEHEQIHQTEPNLLLKPKNKVGIIGYGAYVPRYRLPAKEVARIWGGNDEGLPIVEKAVAGLDEDVITMSIEAARNALKRAAIDRPTASVKSARSQSKPLIGDFPSRETT